MVKTIKEMPLSMKFSKAAVEIRTGAAGRFKKTEEK
jgi:hypothetical protein